MEYISDPVYYIISAIALVFGVLNIVLFFKIWGMTEDVKKLKNKIDHPCAFDVGWEIRKSILKGDTKKVEELLFDEFIYDLKQACGVSNGGSDEEIADLKSNYAQYYKKAGLKFPDSIQNLKSKADFYKVFTFSI